MRKILDRIRSLDATKHRVAMAVVVAVAIAGGLSASQLMEAAGWLNGIEGVLSSLEGAEG